MAQAKVLSESEQSKLTVLLQEQPKSTNALQVLIDKIKVRAVQIATDDARVAARVKGKRSRVVGFDFAYDKSKDNGKNRTRLAEIGIYDYDDDVLLVPIVDLGKGTVTAIEERRGYHPALTADEIEEAKNIALAQREFQSLKRRSGLEVTAYPARAAAIPSHPGYGHRCVTLYFWSGGKQPQRVSQAVVDLSTRKLISGDAEGEPFVER
jgi:Cu2+-containing amine oxidase